MICQGAKIFPFTRTILSVKGGIHMKKTIGILGGTPVHAPLSRRTARRESALRENPPHSGEAPSGYSDKVPIYQSEGERFAALSSESEWIDRMDLCA